MILRLLGLGVLAGLLLQACATPVGVKRIDPRAAHRRLTRSVLSSGELSVATLNVLYRRDLVELWDDEPERAIARIHEDVVAGIANRDDLFALSELSFLLGEEEEASAHLLASTIYAWAFLFPGQGQPPMSPFDPRFRVAADLYNRGLSLALTGDHGRGVDVHGGTFALPFGSLAVDFDSNDLVWGRRRLTEFTSVADVDVRGLPTRYRRAGLGAPLAAKTAPLDPEKGFDDFVEPWAKVPVSAILRLPEPREQLKGKTLQAKLELRTLTSGGYVNIDGTNIPVEGEFTATLADALEEAPIWQQELSAFLQGAGIIDERSRLAALTPYRPGRVPIVLVHGTASSSGRWAQMVNELQNDPRFQGRIAFWLFTYSTGNPILYSAMLLRESLSAAVEQLDPEGRDPALRNMVVIGHSQGGLLTKLTAVDSGDRLWKLYSKKPFDELDFRPKTRDLIKRSTFVKPLPFVRRVVFIATPQHGSYFAGNWLSHQVARFITMPLDITHVATDLMRGENPINPGVLGQTIATAVHNMTPGSPFIRALADIPVSPEIAAHSIIPVDGDGPLDDGTDGIVAYQSAHIDGVRSEKVVHSGHSCQDNPHTIDEVRRILVEHLDGTIDAVQPPPPTPH